MRHSLLSPRIESLASVIAERLASPRSSAVSPYADVEYLASEVARRLSSPSALASPLRKGIDQLVSEIAQRLASPAIDIDSLTSAVMSRLSPRAQDVGKRSYQLSDVKTDALASLVATKLSQQQPAQAQILEVLASAVASRLRQPVLRGRASEVNRVVSSVASVLNKKLVPETESGLPSDTVDAQAAITREDQKSKAEKRISPAEKRS